MNITGSRAQMPMSLSNTDTDCCDPMAHVEFLLVGEGWVGCQPGGLGQQYGWKLLHGSHKLYIAPN